MVASYSNSYAGKDKQTGTGIGFIKNRISIDERSQIVDDKTRVSDWRIALVIDNRYSGALVTIVEQKPASPCG